MDSPKKRAGLARKPEGAFRAPESLPRSWLSWLVAAGSRLLTRRNAASPVRRCDLASRWFQAIPGSCLPTAVSKSYSGFW